MNKIKKGGVRCQFIKTKNIEKLEDTTKLIHRKLSNSRKYCKSSLGRVGFVCRRKQ